MEQDRSSHGSSGKGKNKGGNRSNANNHGSRNNNWKGNQNKGGAGRSMSAAQHGYHKKLQSICALFNQGGCASPCPKGLKHICSKVTDNDSMRMCYSDQHPLIEHQWSMNWWTSSDKIVYSLLCIWSFVLFDQCLFKLFLFIMYFQNKQLFSCFCLCWASQLLIGLRTGSEYKMAASWCATMSAA